MSPLELMNAFAEKVPDNAVAVAEYESSQAVCGNFLGQWQENRASGIAIVPMKIYKRASRR